MNRKTNIFILALTSVLFSVPFIAPTSAATIYTEHISIMADDIIVNIPGITPTTGLRITFAHFDAGDHGIRDNIGLYLFSSMANRWILTSWYSDTNRGFAYISELMVGSQAKVAQLKPNELQVRGETNIIGRWSVPLVSPAISALGFPEIVLPPGHITLNQYGEISSGTTITPKFPSGFFLTIQGYMYNADGHFVCPEWNFNGDITGKINPDTTQIATKT